jgi:hypothetical protein
MGGRDRRGVAGDAVCPAWCRGCGPDDPMHRSELLTVGREGGGWVSLSLVLDRFCRREPMMRLDATRDGATQTVVLSVDQVGRLLLELARGHAALRTTGAKQGSGRFVGPAGPSTTLA